MTADARHVDTRARTAPRHRLLVRASEQDVPEERIQERARNPGSPGSVLMAAVGGSRAADARCHEGR
jgi:hypothetical protein